MTRTCEQLLVPLLLILLDSKLIMIKVMIVGSQQWSHYSCHLEVITQTVLQIRRRIQTLDARTGGCKVLTDRGFGQLRLSRTAAVHNNFHERIIAVPIVPMMFK